MKLKKIITMVLTTTIMLSTISINVFANVKQDNIPINLQIPVLGYDDDTIVLTWEKGKAYENIVDYKIYANGEFIGYANENFEKYSDFTNEYIESFYEGDTDNFHTEIQMMSYRVDGLNHDTEYTFTVTGVLANGKETQPCEAITQKTTKTQEEVNILDFGAKNTGRIIDYKGREDEIKANTKSIQNAIDACSEGGKVVIPEGIYTCGSIWLKSNMTLELQEGAVLSGSTNVDDYEQNYLLRDYSTDRRTWGLINAYGKDGTLENIRIVGQGTIDGNGWKYGSESLGYTTDVVYQEKDVLDPKDEEYNLPLFVAGNNANVYNAEDKSQSLGILAADAVEKALNNGYTKAEAYSTRPTLMILKGAHNIYIEDITLTNPAFHGMSLGDCENVAINSIKNLSYDNNNGDGIGIDSSSDVTIFNSFFDTGDDAINFAAGLGALSSTYSEAVSDVRIFNNFVRESHGGIIAAGSHTGAWFYDIVAEDNVSNLSDMPFRFKSNPVNGGGIKNVIIRDNAVANPTKQAFIFTTKYTDGNQILEFEPSETVAKFQGIDVKNVTVKGDISNKGVVPIKVEGSLSDGHNGINFTNVTFEDFNKGVSIDSLSNSTFKNITFTGTTPKLDKQWTITNSIDLKFKGDTVKTSVTNNAESKPYFEDTKAVIATVKSQAVDLSWTEAKDDTKISKYVVLTYKGKELLHEVLVDGNMTTYKEDGLMPGVKYTFVVQAEDATGNRTEKGPSVIVTTLDDNSVGGILEPTSRDIDTVGTTGYTWTNISFYAPESTSIRRYEIYVNETKTSEILNPYITGLIKDGKIQTNVSGLLQGSENTVAVKAVSDSGEVLEYNPIKVTTWNAFDTEAPIWENAVLNADINGSSVNLSWRGASDDSDILGYRIYVNGKAQGDNFNPVNRSLTTKDASYILNDLETGTYEIRVEAGDTWWRSESTSLKIAASTNWTNHGPTITVEVK